MVTLLARPIADFFLEGLIKIEINDFDETEMYRLRPLLRRRRLNVYVPAANLISLTTEINFLG